MIRLGFMVHAPKRVYVEPSEAVAEEGESLHDSYTLIFDSVRAEQVLELLQEHRTSTTGAVGPPAQLAIETGLVRRNVYGYIDLSSIDYEGTATRCSVIFMGASAVLRNGQARTWTEATTFQIASDVLRPHGLGLEMDPAPQIFSFFDQAGDSDWEVLRRLADKNGLSLTADGVVVRMLDMLSESRRARGSSVALYRRPGVAGTRMGQEARKFSIIETASPLGGERHRFYGVDAFGSSFSAEGGASTVTKSPTQQVSSLGDAMREAQRADRAVSYATRGLLVGPGSPVARAGECVAIEDRRALREYWYIVAAQQSYSTSPGAHRANFTLCRPTSDKPFGYTPARRSNERPNPLLVGGKWRSGREWMVQL